MSGDGGTNVTWMTAAQRLAAIRDVLDARAHAESDDGQVITDIEALLEGWQ
jgi:hypothetical protein